MNGPDDWFDLDDVAQLFDTPPTGLYGSLHSYGVEMEKRVQIGGSRRRKVINCYDPDQAVQMAYEHDNFISEPEITNILNRPLHDIRIALASLGIKSKISSGLRKRKGSKLYLKGTENLIE